MPGDCCIYEGTGGVGNTLEEEGGQRLDYNLWGYHDEEASLTTTKTTTAALSNFDTWKTHNFDLEQLPDDDEDVLNDMDGCCGMGSSRQLGKDILVYYSCLCIQTRICPQIHTAFPYIYPLIHPFETPSNIPSNIPLTNPLTFL